MLYQKALQITQNGGVVLSAQAGRVSIKKRTRAGGQLSWMLQQRCEWMDVAVEMTKSGRNYWKMEFVSSIVQELTKIDEEDGWLAVGQKLVQLIKAVRGAVIKNAVEAAVLNDLLKGIVKSLEKLLGKIEDGRNDQRQTFLTQSVKHLYMAALMCQRSHPDDFNLSSILDIISTQLFSSNKDELIHFHMEVALQEKPQNDQGKYYWLKRVFAAQQLVKELQTAKFG